MHTGKHPTFIKTAAEDRIGDIGPGERQNLVN